MVYKKCAKVGCPSRAAHLMITMNFVAYYIDIYLQGEPPDNYRETHLKKKSRPDFSRDGTRLSLIAILLLITFCLPKSSPAP